MIDMKKLSIALFSLDQQHIYFIYMWLNQKPGRYDIIITFDSLAWFLISSNKSIPLEVSDLISFNVHNRRFKHKTTELNLNLISMTFYLLLELCTAVWVSNI